MMQDMHSRILAVLAAAFFPVMACRNRDPQLHDTVSSSADTVRADTVIAASVAESTFVPNDQPVTAPVETRVDTTPKIATTPKIDTNAKPAAKAPVKPETLVTRTPTPPRDTILKPTAGSTTTGAAPVAVTSTPPAPPAVAKDSVVAPKLPFAPGERLEYQVKFGSISVGKAVLEVIGIDTVRGIPAMHIRLTVEGKMAFVSVKDLYESWFDFRTMSSLRYTQDIDEANYERERHYEIYPDRKTYHERGKKELPSVSAPLDDASFLFFLRTIPLVVGQTQSFDRYFKPDRNPVKAVVMRRERITVPAGKFETVVVRPIIKTSGLFSEGGKAEAWFADDESRILIQLKTQLKIGSLNLYLRKIRRAPSTP
jgi:hypothetical protein